MTMHWFTCGPDKLHIIGYCPRCSSSQGGVLVGTVSDTHTGVTKAKCTKCAETVEYYVNARQRLILDAEGERLKKGRIP